MIAKNNPAFIPLKACYLYNCDNVQVSMSWFDLFSLLAWFFLVNKIIGVQPALQKSCFCYLDYSYHVLYVCCRILPVDLLDSIICVGSNISIKEQGVSHDTI
jgi:hypothetical protein